MPKERFLITGGQGFLGSWIVKQLIDEKVPVTLFDLKRDDHILAQVLDRGDVESLDRCLGDVADTDAVLKAVEGARATHVIHLAGLQVPTCRAQPLLGARVNVLGTLNVFEAARVQSPQIVRVVYASSAAVAGAPTDYDGPIADTARHVPRTHYGVFKGANEGNAQVYWNDHGISSIGLRPLTVYGVGRELGITSGPTKAIKAAVLGRRYTIPFTGYTGFDLASDVARLFVASARAPSRASPALNVGGIKATVEEFIQAIELALPQAAGMIRAEGPELPVAYDFSESGLEELLGDTKRTPVVDGVSRTAEHFRRLEERGELSARDLEE